MSQSMTISRNKSYVALLSTRGVPTENQLRDFAASVIGRGLNLGRGLNFFDTTDLRIVSNRTTPNRNGS